MGNQLDIRGGLETGRKKPSCRNRDGIVSHTAITRNWYQSSQHSVEQMSQSKVNEIRNMLDNSSWTKELGLSMLLLLMSQQFFKIWKWQGKWKMILIIKEGSDPEVLNILSRFLGK